MQCLPNDYQFSHPFTSHSKPLFDFTFHPSWEMNIQVKALVSLPMELCIALLFPLTPNNFFRIRLRFSRYWKSFIFILIHLVGLESDDEIPFILFLCELYSLRCFERYPKIKWPDDRYLSSSSGEYTNNICTVNIFNRSHKLSTWSRLLKRFHHGATYILFLYVQVK